MLPALFLLLYRGDSYLITLFSLHIINREFLFDSKLQIKVLSRLKIFDKQSTLKIQIFTKHTIELIKLYSITNGKAVPSRNAKRRQRWRINKSKKDRKCPHPPYLSLILFQHWMEKSNVSSSLFARNTTPPVSKKPETKLSASPAFSLSFFLISYYKKSLL